MSGALPSFVGAVMQLEPFDIDPDEAGRIGLFFPAKAEALGVLIRANGQNDPIKVVATKPGSKFKWRLVAGAHRLAACLNEGMTVAALEVSNLDARAVQASENLDRRELEPLERAMFVHAVADAAKRQVLSEAGVKSQQELAGKARASKAGLVQSKPSEIADEEAEAARANLAHAYGWRDEVAEACGLCLSDLKRALRIYRFVVEPNRDLMDAFKDHPVAKKASDLLEIASIKDGTKRRKVIEVLIAGPKDLDYALRQVGLKSDSAASKQPFDVFCNRIKGTEARMGFGDFQRFSDVFAAHLTQARRIALRDALNEQIEQGEVE